MVAVAFTFPAGRYHATPWERHVNEGAVAWPPEPWRILRALIATWHHKVKHGGRHAEDTLPALIDSLAQTLPEYHLPPASHSHLRHYMPQFEDGTTSLVLDAFVAVGRDAPLTVSWTGVDLPKAQTALLDELLGVMGYLGRAESWVEARRIESAPPANCVAHGRALDTETGEIRAEPVTLMAPLPAADYQALRAGYRDDKKLQATLPGNLLDALSIDTGELRKQGWNRPPAARAVTYFRPIDALRPVRTVRPAPVQATTSLLFVLVGRPLPRVEDSLRIGELFRAAVMSQAARRLGEKQIPPTLSGHDLPSGPSHRHAFYLPWDSDGDGRIDRLLLHVPLGIGAAERSAIEGLSRLWGRDGTQWRVALEGSGSTELPLLRASRRWLSLTPYLHPWHCRKGCTVEDQIRRECRERGLPEPASLERVRAIDVDGQPCRTIQFHRFRSRKTLHQPDRTGSFWSLEFAEPVAGPVALGFGCHFGLGLFAPQ